MMVVKKQVGDGAGASSLGAVGNVVGAAVGGVSQAVTSVATTAETGELVASGWLFLVAWLVGLVGLVCWLVGLLGKMSGETCQARAKTCAV